MVLLTASDQAMIAAVQTGDIRGRLLLKTRLAEVVERIFRTQSPRYAIPKPKTIKYARHFIWTVLRFERFTFMSDWDQRSDFDTYLCLFVAKRLEAYVPKLLQRRLEDGRAAFLGLFGRSIERQVAKLCQKVEDREDAFSDLIERLWEPNEKKPDEGPSYRLKAYRNEGSYAAFVRKVVERLLIDWLRKRIGRRRLPAAVQRLPELERAIYRALYWDGTAPTASALMAVVAWRIPGVQPADVAAGYRRLRDCLLKSPQHGHFASQPRTGAKRSPDEKSAVEPATGGGATGTAGTPFPQPDDAFGDNEDDLFGAATAAMRALFASLSENERTYARLMLQGIKRNKMPWPEKETDQIKRRVRLALQKFKLENEAASRWYAHISTPTGATL